MSAKGDIGDLNTVLTYVGNTLLAITDWLHRVSTPPLSDGTLLA